MPDKISEHVDDSENVCSKGHFGMQKMVERVVIKLWDVYGRLGCFSVSVCYFVCLF